MLIRQLAVVVGVGSAFALSLAAPLISRADVHVPKPLDGVNIEAVEVYPSRKNHQVSLGVGLYPFNAYYTGALLSGGYIYNFSGKVAWEVVQGGYAYSIQNGLTTELADKYEVNPREVERLEFLISSNLHYTIANGKTVFLDDYIRYFRVAAIGGLGMVKTKQAANPAACFGLKLEAFTAGSLSWYLDVRNSMVVPAIDNYVNFGFGLTFGL